MIARTHVCNDTFHQLPAAKALLSIAVEGQEREVIGKTFGDVLEMSTFAYFEVSHPGQQPFERALLIGGYICSSDSLSLRVWH